MSNRQNRWRTLCCERLENRRLLAADLTLSQPSADLLPVVERSEASLVDRSLMAEGEAGPASDLVAFAQQLASSEARLYCADWASACAQQLALFEDGADSLPYVEVGTPARGGNSIAAALGIVSVPTWIMSDGSRISQVASLEALATAESMVIPQSTLPYLAPPPDAIVYGQSPLHIPLDGYDPNGDSLTYKVHVADPSVVSGEILEGNRSLRFSLEDYGDMVFQLFEQRATRPASRVIELAESGFYDGVEFHRIVDEFVIQGGDPTGTGRGGSTLGQFDDQFHLELQHNASGLLSYAKSTDDTGDSQFFITEGVQRHLDFNHAIFGTLVEGERVREGISRTAAVSQRPLFEVTIDEATVFLDSENAVLLLRPIVQGQTTVTVTATDADGNSTERQFEVTVDQDLVNTPPFLEDVGDQMTVNGVPSTFGIQGVDRESDELVYSAAVVGSVPSSGEITAFVDAGGVVNVESPERFVGQIQVRVTVEQAEGTPSGEGSRDDNQLVTIDVVSSHQNQMESLDVNADGFVTPSDVLVVINFLNSSPASNSTFGMDAPAPYRDVNGDLYITPLDALLLVNHLNSEVGGEAEPGVSVEAATEVLVASWFDSLVADREKNRRFWA